MDYKATLNLPRTDFPMRANLPEREPELLRRWEAADIYGQLRRRAADLRRPRWILHDGPPYANGHIHMGTALNKVLKDLVVKSKTMLGYDAVYVPGWDCHGLPIEHQVDKELGLDRPGVDVRRAMDPMEKRRRCRAYALRFIDIQREEFRRLGVFGDWAHPYQTMAPAYQATIVREFGRFVDRGIVYCAGCGHILLDERVVEHVAGIMRTGAGADEWYLREADGLLPSGTRCPKCGHATFRKESDILDVWFDSGCSHAAVLEPHAALHWPAEMYLEGSDQHRGWFHSSLLEAMGTRNAPPYRAVLTHGFVVDGEGRKMSKSLGNVVAPDDVIKRYGAEVLRLWAASEDYTEDMRLSDEILTHLAEAYRRIRNTCRFLLGNLADFHPARDAVPYEALEELDRWALLRLGRLIDRVRKAYDDYQFHLAFQSLHNFCAVDLSALYLDVLKDRLYISPAAAAGRRAAQTVCHRVLDALVRLMAPILTFTAEEVWDHVPGAGKAASVHLTDLPDAQPAWLDAALEADWERLLALRGEVSRALEQARAARIIGAGLDAAVTLQVEDAELAALLEGKDALARDLCIVSRLERRPGALPPGVETGPDRVALRETRLPGVGVLVEHATGAKCERCWMWSEAVGRAPDHPGLCARCLPIVRAGGRA